jgi:putative ABC transport system substrate-binding protein
VRARARTFAAPTRGSQSWWEDIGEVKPLIMRQMRDRFGRAASLGVLSLGLATLSLTVFAEAQQKVKVPVIGFLRSGPAPQAFVDGFRQGLRELGYVEGQNVIIEYRFGDGGTAQLAELGSELLRLKVDIILASATPAAAFAAKNLARTVPVVFAGVVDPVDSGIVNSLSRPGGNITGTSHMSIDLTTKRLELLKELVPKISRVGVLGNPEHPSYTSQIRAIEAGAQSLGIRVERIDIRDPGDFEAAFRAAQRVHGLIQLDDVLFSTHRRPLVERALANRLPVVYGFREHVEAGGLLSYGANFRELYRQAAVFVDKILKGARPDLLPVERATKFELLINNKAATALGLTIPPSILLRADEIVD